MTKQQLWDRYSGPSHHCERCDNLGDTIVIGDYYNYFDSICLCYDCFMKEDENE